MSKSDSIKLLNLVKDLDERERALFDSFDVEWLERGSVQTYEEIDYILVASEEEAFRAEKDFDCIANEIQIISLGKTHNMRKFLLSNGRLVVDTSFLNTNVAKKLLRHYLLEEKSIHLDENFTQMASDVESFKLTGHLHVGDFFDRLQMRAFEKGFNIVSLRTYLDHTLMYFTYLKQSGLSSMPIEVESAFVDEDTFAVNIHASVRNFVAEYMIDSFGGVDSKRPLQYLMSIISKSCDFMEITRIEKPQKIVFTAFWNKSNDHSGRGILFNNIYTTAQIEKRLERKIRQFKSSEENEQEQIGLSEELAEKKLPGGILELTVEDLDEESVLNRSPEKTAELMAFVIGHFEEVGSEKSLEDIDVQDYKQALSSYPDTDFIQQLSDDDIENLLEKTQKRNISKAYSDEMSRVRSLLEDEDDFKKELSDTLTEEVVQRVSGSLDAEAINRIIGGKEEDDDFKQVVKGLEDDSKKDLALKISGAFEQKQKDFKTVVSSGGGGQDKGLFNFVSMAMEGVNDLKLKPNVKQYVKNFAGKKVSSALAELALSRGLEVDQLSDEDLNDFRLKTLPSILSETLEQDYNLDEYLEELKSDSPFASEMPEGTDSGLRLKFKQRLEEKLEKVEGLARVDGKYEFTDENVHANDVQEVIRLAMREAMDEDLKLASGSREEINQKEQQIIKSLSQFLDKEEDEVQEIVKGATKVVKDFETQKVVENLFKEGEQEFAKEKTGQAGAQDEAQLLELVKKYEKENSKLKNQLEAERLNSHAKKDEQGIIDRINEQVSIESAGLKDEDLAASESDQRIAEAQESMESVGEELKQALREGRPLSEEDSEKVLRALAKEQELIEAAKALEVSLKKNQIEMSQKESLFRSEITKANKNLKGKDTVIDRVKSSMQELMTKKQNELLESKKLIEELNQRLENDEAPKLLADIKGLKKDYENASRLAEMYKKKVDIMVKAQKKAESNNEAAQLAAENRDLSRVKIQLENKLRVEGKEKKMLESQLLKIKEQEGKLRAMLSKAEGQYKDALIQMDKMKANESRLIALAEKPNAAAQNNSSKELETLKNQNLQLQTMIKDLKEKMKSGPASASAGSNGPQSVKEKRLEQSVKKLNTELSRARNEVNDQKKQIQKHKSEVVALKNKIKQLEKNGSGKKAA